MKTRNLQLRRFNLKVFNSIDALRKTGLFALLRWIAVRYSSSTKQRIEVEYGICASKRRMYLAELVQELTVEEDSRNVVWRNLTLVHAHSPDEAHDKTLSLGRAGDTEYLNPSGKQVTVRFQGIFVYGRNP